MRDNFIAIRIRPDSPVDGETFSTYLDSLQNSISLSNRVSIASNATVTFPSNLNSGVIEHGGSDLRDAR